MKVSIVTINYNNKAGLIKTLDSVYRQSFPDMEMVIIDGGSTDGSAECVDSYKSRIGFFVSEKDKGIYHAQNKGWQHAKGEFVLFLNSGDVFAADDVLERVFSVEQAADIIYGNMLIVAEDGSERLGKMPSKIGIKQLYKDTLWHPVSFIRTSLFSKHGGYDESLKIVADYDFFCREILKFKAKLSYVDVTISKFDTTGLSSNPARKTQIAAERKLVQDRYMSGFLLFFFRMYSKWRA